MDGILGEMELAALPGGPSEDGTAHSAQPSMVVRDDKLDPAQTTGNEIFEEVAPV